MKIATQSTARTDRSRPLQSRSPVAAGFSNVLISNVPGPQVPLHVCGARMLHFYPVSIPYHGTGLNITAQSYAGSLDFDAGSVDEARPARPRKAVPPAKTAVAQRKPRSRRQTTKETS